MTLSSYMVDHLNKLEDQWGRALRTLPERDLIEQRDILREKAIETIGGKHLAAALVLRLLNAEMRRRHDGELPL